MKKLFGVDLEKEYKNDTNILRSPIDIHIKNRSDSWSNLIWEYDCTDMVMNYQEHEERIKKFNMERAPAPQEVFSLFIAFYEGKLPSMKKRLVEKILWSSEFFCFGAKIEEDILCIYENLNNIANLKEMNSYNLIDNTDYWTKKIEFFIGGLKKGKINYLRDIAQINPKVVEYFYTRPYEKLPMVMQDKTGIYMPISENLSPICKEGLESPFSINLIVNSTHSRGVRIKNE